jgi:predicted nuclease of predicted toxin-antitoxin system
MSLSILIDMNLSPRWVSTLQRAGWAAIHWSTVGDQSASDMSIMDWADNNGHIVFTNDLDFGALLALSRRGKPSVIQLRSQDVLPEAGAGMLISALQRFEEELRAGALITIDADKQRVRLLPF